MGQSIKPWIAATVFVALIIGVLGWFVGISPALAETAETRDAIESEENRSIILQAQLDLLKQQYEDLDTYREELAAVSVQIPSEAESSEFRRLLNSRAEAAGLTILSINTGVALVVTASAPTEATTESTGAAGDGTEASTTTTAAPAATSGSTVVGIPVSISTLGTYDATRAFIASLQGTTERLYIFSSLGAVTQQDAPESPARPETKAGDVETTIDGYILVLKQTTTADTGTTGGDGTTDEGTVDPSASPEPVPLPTTGRNPFAPYAGD